MRMRTCSLVAVACALIPLPVLGGGSAAAEEPVRTVEVSYGHAPVTQGDVEERLRLRFHGREGDRVALWSSLVPIHGEPLNGDCEDVALSGAEGVVPQRASGFHVLPSTGPYVFDYSQDCLLRGPGMTGGAPMQIPATVVLTTLNVVPLRPGQEIRLAARRGFVTAARVTVGRLTTPQVLRQVGRPTALSVATAASQREVLDAVRPALPDPVIPGSAVVEHGAPAVVLPTDRDEVPRFGRGGHLFFAHGVPVRLRLERLRAQRVTFRSHPVEVAHGDVRRLSFRGRAGQWVRLRGTVGSGHRLSSSPGVTVMPAGKKLWRLQATGVYRLDVVGGRGGARVVLRRAAPPA